jgi:hypothetical protein
VRRASSQALALRIRQLARSDHLGLDATGGLVGETGELRGDRIEVYESALVDQVRQEVPDAGARAGALTHARQDGTPILDGMQWTEERPAQLWGVGHEPAHPLEVSAHRLHGGVVAGDREECARVALRRC